LGRPFWDTDVLITEKTGKTPAEIIRNQGEKVFRDIETEVIQELSSQNGSVIATGGGAVLRLKNVELLRSNSKIYFLDRPVDQLVPTQDRPLSATKEAILERYRERYPIYMKVADCRIPVAEGDVDGAVAAILAAFSEGYDF
jgi:shikimate kinase